MYNKATQFAPVAPVKLLLGMLGLPPDIHGTYHLLLAHDVREHKDLWKIWAKEARERHADYGQDFTVIMDSSVIELGHPVPMDEILEACEIVEANILVLPDIIGDFEATQQLIAEALNRKDVRKYKTMLVPQGMTLEQYILSLEVAAKYDWGDYIGLPRDAQQYGINRAILSHVSNLTNPEKPVHLLGFGNTSVSEDFIACKTTKVYGIDSAVPVRAGQRDITFSIAQANYGPRGNYWGDTKITHQAAQNIRYVRHLLSA